MAINLIPHPQDAPAIVEAQTATASPAPHILIGSAIMLVATALALFISVQLGAPAVAGLAAGVAFAIGAGWVHLKVSSPSKAVVMRQMPTLDAPVKSAKAKKRAKAVEVRPEPALSHHDLDAQASIVDVAVTPDAEPVVEPGDLALALLASLNAQREAVVAGPPASDSWNQAIAAHLEQPRAQAAHADFGLPPPPIAVASVEAETEVQRVERLVKRLADNVNQLQAMREAQAETIAAKPAVVAAAPIAYQDAEQLPLFPDSDASQLEASINALRRANAAAAPAVAPVTETHEPDHAWSAAPPAIDPHASSQRNSILSALNEQRIDVFLEPILDLADQRPQHYEVSISLRTFGGHAIDLTQAANDLSGTGLLPLIDQARIARAASIARRLADRGKSGAVFAELNGETLDDGGFQETFANDTMSVGAFPGQLVLTLPQAHVATFTTADWHTLARLREAGFGFALSDVTTLDMDFARLAQTGFVFARLDADTFLIGLPTSGMIVPPADICRHLAECGLMLIVGGIVEDHQLARIFGFGVLFGQGQLFGGPRAMKADATSASSARYGEAPAAHA